MSCMAEPCQSGSCPLTLTLTLSPKGRGDGYRGAMRSAYCTLPAGAGIRPNSAKDAAAPDCRRHIALLPCHELNGANGLPRPYYGARTVLSIDLMS
ncbi:hypothetical protein VAWG007_15000 [Aeromonas enteropelogenes]|nr:hypothetical protein VAWG007_15000 [Aeromonas enteropelogenes]